MKTAVPILNQFIFNKIATVFAINLFLLAMVSFSSCKEKKKPVNFCNKDISHVITKMTDIMVHDVTNPPLAARFFAYACLAGYEIASENNPIYKSMHGVLNDYPLIQKPDSIADNNYQLAALLAMMETAKRMQPSGKVLDDFQEHFLDSCMKAGIDEAVITQSKKYALAISKQVLAYAKADGYNKISNLPRYTPIRADKNWYPTPPAFMAAVEPYFNTVRPFTLDSAGQFKPAPPAAFDPKKGSAFYTLTEAVYKESITISPEHRTIAAFWDCNPFAMEDDGHLQYGNKKISPGAHWMGIAGIACENTHKDFNAAMQVYTAVAVTLMDAFICCWDEKFRSNRVRPESAIRKYIDPQWTPLLQTPPFPEYVSGHSTISAASAVILSHYTGQQLPYTDSVEVSYGLPPRSFTSFTAAAAEAGISRFYGGIHFMDAIDNGRLQGQAVGEWALKRMKK